MRETLLLAIGVIAFVAAAFVPGGAIDSARDVATDMTGSERTVLHAGQSRAAEAHTDDFAAWSAGRTELSRAQDGHFYADAMVDGRPVHFLVDTGATTIALTGDDAAALGLYWNDADLRPVAQGAGGPVYGVQVRLDTVELGGHSARGIEAMIIPKGLGISLLGQTFLSTIDPVTIEGDRMVLGR